MSILSEDKVASLRKYNLIAVAVHGISTISQIYLGAKKSKWKFSLTTQQFPDYVEAAAKSLETYLKIKGYSVKIDYNKDGFYTDDCNSEKKTVRINFLDKDIAKIVIAKNVSEEKKNNTVIDYTFDSSGENINRIGNYFLLTDDQMRRLTTAVGGFYLSNDLSNDLINDSTAVRFNQVTLDTSSLITSGWRTNNQYFDLVYTDLTLFEPNNPDNRMSEGSDLLQKQLVVVTLKKCYKLKLNDVILLDASKPLTSSYSTDKIHIYKDGKQVATIDLPSLTDVARGAFPNLRPIAKKINPSKKIPLAATVAAFSGICLLAHLTLLYLGEFTPRDSNFNYYKMILVDRINYVRWFEYSLSSGLMLVNIAVICRMTDLFTMLSIFTLTGITNFFGLWTEMAKNRSFKVVPFTIGFIPFIVPWIIIARQNLYSANYFDAQINPLIKLKSGKPLQVDIPLIFTITTIGLFVIYLAFPINMFLQYWVFKKDGYYKGEIGYLLLSAISKSFLSWMIFAGTLTQNEDYLE